MPPRDPMSETRRFGWSSPPDPDSLRRAQDIVTPGGNRIRRENDGWSGTLPSGAPFVSKNAQRASDLADGRRKMGRAVSDSATQSRLQQLKGKAAAGTLSDADVEETYKLLGIDSDSVLPPHQRKSWGHPTPGR